jgi:sugar/nucleoside kinase (ribokinase family)
VRSSSESREFDLCAFSDALTDVIYRVEDFSRLKELGLERGRSIRLGAGQQQRLLSALDSMKVVSVSAGGSPTNTLCGAARLGCKSAFIGLLGDDEYSAQYLDALSSAGVTPFTAKRSGNTGVCYTFVDDKNERSFGIALGVAETLQSGDLDFDAIGRARHFHTSAYQLRGSADAFKVLKVQFQKARQSGTSISFDLGDPGVIDEYREQIMELLDEPIAVLQANAAEAQAFAGGAGNKTGPMAPEDLALQLLDYAESVVITRAEEGCTVCSKNELWTLPALNVKTPVDFNGAGDAFGAGFLYGFLGSASLKDSARIGIYYASLIISKLGAQLPETFEDIEKAAEKAFSNNC